MASVPALRVIERGFAESQHGPWHHRYGRAGAPGSAEVLP